MKLIDIGYGNYAARERVVAICPPDSAPMKRLLSDSKENGRAIDVTCGKRTRSIIILDTEYILLCALPPQKVSERFNGERDSGGGEDDEE